MLDYMRPRSGNGCLKALTRFVGKAHSSTFPCP